MQAWGHEELSEKRLELREEELARNNREASSVGAYYLGNWLTDISQVMSFVHILESKLHEPLVLGIDAVSGFVGRSRRSDQPRHTQQRRQAQRSLGPDRENDE